MSQLRTSLIRLAYQMPQGSLNRRRILSLLVKEAISFTPQSVDIQTHSGPVPVDAVVAGVWAVHKKAPLGHGRGWVVTHVPTGRALKFPRSKKEGMRFIESMAEAEPALMRAQSESDLRRYEDVLVPLMSGELPFESIMRSAGLENLGTRYGKKGDHWGIPGGSMMIRVGARDLVLMQFEIYGWKMAKGREVLDTAWRMADIEHRNKVERFVLDRWIRQVKSAPSMQEMRDEYRASGR